MGQFEKSNTYASKVRELASTVGKKDLIPETLVYTARYYGRVSRSDTSVQILKSVEKDFPDYFLSKGSYHFKTLGMFYNHLNILDTALHYTLIADSMAVEEFGKDQYASLILFLIIYRILVVNFTSYIE